MGRAFIKILLGLSFFLSILSSKVLAGECTNIQSLVLVSQNFKPYLQVADKIEKTIYSHCKGARITRKIMSGYDRGFTVNDLPNIKLVFAVGTEALIYAKKHFPLAIKVFSMVLEPPINLLDEKVYGVALSIDYRKELSVLKRLAPEVDCIGCLYSEESRHVAKRINQIAKAQGLKAILVELDSMKNLEIRLRQVFDKADAVIAIPDTKIYNNILAPRIIYTAIRYRKPFIGLSKKFTAAGALFSLDCDYLHCAHRAAIMGLSLMEGKQVSPRIVYCNKFTGYLNLRTARLISLKINPEILKDFVVVSH